MAHVSGVGTTGGSKTVSTFSEDPAGHGRRVTSSTAVSLQREPSIANRIFIDIYPQITCARPIPLALIRFSAEKPKQLRGISHHTGISRSTVSFKRPDKQPGRRHARCTKK